MRETQHSREIEDLLGLLKKARPRTVLEIGIDWGGTFSRWCDLVGPFGKVIGIDRDEKTLDKIRLNGILLLETAIILIGDSKDENIFKSVETNLEGRSVDFLFIDGDHSYEGVKSDYEIFSRLVRDGGLIAFHDIATPATTRNPYRKGTMCGVCEFWNQLKGGYKREFVWKEGRPRFGIGVIAKNVG